MQQTEKMQFFFLRNSPWSAGVFVKLRLRRCGVLGAGEDLKGRFGLKKMSAECINRMAWKVVEGENNALSSPVLDF